MDYTAFGEEIAANVGMRTTVQGFNTPNKLDEKYAQTERDKATGLDHTWFRKLENQGGRWTSPDPYNGSISLGDPQSFNRYSYVNNQPTNFIDPSGLNEEAPILRITTSIRGDAYNSFARFLWFVLFGSSGGGSVGGGGGIEGGGGSTGGTEPSGGGDKDENLPFKNCSEFVDWLIKQAKGNPTNIHNKRSRATLLGTDLMYLSYFGYDRHINNGYAGFRGILVAPGTGTSEGPQGAGVYGHILGMSGAYLTETIGGAIGTVNSLIDRVQGFGGKPQSPAEIAGNQSGTAVGKHIWNYLNGNGNETDLKKSLTSELCDTK